MKTKTYWIIYNNQPVEVDLVGKFIPENDYYSSKFQYIYQVRTTESKWADEVKKTREEIYLSKKDAELALSAAENLEKIRQAEITIRRYKDAVEVIKKTKKDGLQDIDFVMKLTEEKTK